MAVRLQPGSKARVALAVAAAGLSLSACATAPAPYRPMARSEGAQDRLGSASRPRAYNRPYQVRGRWYTPRDQPGYDEVGLASWYSYESPSHTTADGEVFDIRVASAAHTTLPIPSWLEVTNLDNGRSARVRLNDRGPFVAGRILDLSRGAADELGFASRGVAHVRVRYLGPAEPMAGRPMVWARAAPDRMIPRPRGPDRFTSASASGEVAEDAAIAPNDPGDDSSGPASRSPVVASGFIVQAGAFADRANAERAAERLAQTGDARVRPSTRADGAVLYRVVVGGWAGASQAASARSQIAALGFADARVIAP